MRSSVLVFLLAACSHVPSLDDERPSLPVRPNVVFFLVDDMGWMDTSVYGSEYYETPNIERLAARGMTFTNAYSANPLCSPTRASLLTGQYPARLGFTAAWGHRRPVAEGRPFYAPHPPANEKVLTPRSVVALPPEEDTIADVLGAGGYATAHIGKWHIGREPDAWATERGFDVAFHGAPDAGPPSYFSPYGFSDGPITDGPDGEYITDRLTDEALAFLEDHAREPFLLHLWHYGVHGPFGAKVELTERFRGKEDPRGVQGNPIMASMIASIDESLGRVLDKLEELGIDDRTIVIFSSDNGGDTESFTGPHIAFIDTLDADDPTRARAADWKRLAGDRGPTSNLPLRRGKGYLYEGGTRVPLIVAWPGVVAPNSTSNAVFTSPDYFPTVLSMVGIAPGRAKVLDGLDLVPVLRGEASSADWEERAVFCHFPHRFPYGRLPGVSVRRGRWKLIRWFETDDVRTSPFELYDLEADLGETNDVSAAQPDVVRELDALIDRHLADTGARVPIPNPNYDPR